MPAPIGTPPSSDNPGDFGGVLLPDANSRCRCRRTGSACWGPCAGRAGCGRGTRAIVRRGPGTVACVFCVAVRASVAGSVLLRAGSRQLACRWIGAQLITWFGRAACASGVPEWYALGPDGRKPAKVAWLKERAYRFRLNSVAARGWGGCAVLRSRSATAGLAGRRRNHPLWRAPEWPAGGGRVSYSLGGGGGPPADRF